MAQISELIGKGAEIKVEELTLAVQRASQGERVRPPAGSSTEVTAIYATLSEIAERLSKGPWISFRDELSEAMHRASMGERVRPPAGSSPDVARLYVDILELAEKSTKIEQREKQNRTEITQTVGLLDETIPRLEDSVTSVLHASEQATSHSKEMATALANIAQSIETLASSAEESSSNNSSR